jgi:hypothetical protein
MLVSRPGLGLETVQDHFLVVLVMVLVSIGPVLVLVLVLTGLVLVLVLVSDVPVLITSLRQTDKNKMYTRAICRISFTGLDYLLKFVVIASWVLLCQNSGTVSIPFSYKFVVQMRLQNSVSYNSNYTTRCDEKRFLGKKKNNCFSYRSFKPKLSYLRTEGIHFKSSSI